MKIESALVQEQDHELPYSRKWFGDLSSDLHRHGRLVQLALWLAPTVVLGGCAYAHRWVTDDAFIDFRIVNNLLHGYGPVFNPGERIEAYTNPLWVALLALWGLTGARLEIGAVFLNLVLGLTGLLAAQASAANIQRRLQPGKALVFLPAGSLVLMALPPVWDFITSGLEMGLAFAWLGISCWLLARLLLPVQQPHWGWTAGVLGLGPLIRPDLLIYSGMFFLALAVCYGWRWRLLHLGFATSVLPAGYELFRIAYFGSLVPNTALAKSASGSYWSQGIVYLVDFIAPYIALVPIIIVVLAIARLVKTARDVDDWPALSAIVAPVLAGLCHGLYIVRAGGDFMHARLLLPGLFGLIAPVAVLGLPVGRRDRACIGLLVGLLIWAIPCLFFWRTPYFSQIGPNQIANERGAYIQAAGTLHPVFATDYAASRRGRDGMALRQQAAQTMQPLVLVDNTPDCRPVETAHLSSTCLAALRTLPSPLPVATWISPTTRLIVLRASTGVVSYLVGPNVFVVDQLGLSDPVAARLQLTKRGRPGHEKVLPNAWYIARFTAPGPANADSPDVRAARAALNCGDLSLLQRAVAAPLTPTRLFNNVRYSWSLFQLRIPQDPFQAQAQFCH